MRKDCDGNVVAIDHETAVDDIYDDIIVSGKDLLEGISDGRLELNENNFKDLDLSDYDEYIEDYWPYVQATSKAVPLNIAEWERANSKPLAIVGCKDLFGGFSEKHKK